MLIGRDKDVGVPGFREINGNVDFTFISITLVKSYDCIYLTSVPVLSCC